jgi:hypothetical protein
MFHHWPGLRRLQVTIVNNTAIGLGDNFNGKIHAGKNTTNLTATGNTPAGPLPVPPPPPGYVFGVENTRHFNEKRVEFTPVFRHFQWENVDGFDPRPPQPPSTIQAFCPSSAAAPCVKALTSPETVPATCTGDFQHVEQVSVLTESLTESLTEGLTGILTESLTGILTAYAEQERELDRSLN